MCTHYSASYYNCTGMQKLIDSMHVTEIVRAGGAGSKGILVLDGVVDAYVFPQNGTHRWDTCAIDAILHAYNGCLTDAYGDAYDYGVRVQCVSMRMREYWVREIVSSIIHMPYRSI